MEISEIEELIAKHRVLRPYQNTENYSYYFYTLHVRSRSFQHDLLIDRASINLSIYLIDTIRHNPRQRSMSVMELIKDFPEMKFYY